MLRRAVRPDSNGRPQDGALTGVKAKLAGQVAPCASRAACFAIAVGGFRRVGGTGCRRILLSHAMLRVIDAAFVGLNELRVERLPLTGFHWGTWMELNMPWMAA